MVEKFENKDVFAKRMNSTRVQNLIDYLDMIPSECAMKLWQLLSSDNTNEDNMLDIHSGTTSNGDPVSSILVRMYEG